MNKRSAQELKKVYDCLKEAKSLLSGLAETMEEEFNEKSEKWQESEAGEALQAGLEILHEADEILNDLTTKLDEIEQ